MSNPYLTVDSISLAVGGNPILQNVSFEAHPGEVLGIVGRNGSGKSVLFKCVAGLFTPQQGEIVVGGFPVVRSRRFPPDLGALIEKPGFVGSLSGLENLQLLASIRGIVGTPAIMEALETVGLSAAARKRVRTYSLGMKQRLGIAQAIMEHPRLVILDEPTSGLDLAGVEMLHGVVRGLAADGATVLIASHLSEDIAVLSDRVLAMDAGVLSAKSGDVRSSDQVEVRS